MIGLAKFSLVLSLFATAIHAEAQAQNGTNSNTTQPSTNGTYPAGQNNTSVVPNNQTYTAPRNNTNPSNSTNLPSQNATGQNTTYSPGGVSTSTHLPATCEAPPKYNHTNTTGFTNPNYNGAMVAFDVKLKENTPAGVNLGAVMASIVQTDSKWLLQNRVKKISSTEATVIVRTPSGTDMDVTVSYANLTHNFSPFVSWPNVFEAALLKAGYPSEYNGASLASMTVSTAFTALTGLSTIVTYTGSSAPTMDWFKAVYYMTSNIPARYPMVAVTKPDGNFTDNHIKRNYAYSILGRSGVVFWLYDTAGDNGSTPDFTAHGYHVVSQSTAIYSLKGMTPSQDPNDQLTYSWT